VLRCGNGWRNAVYQTLEPGATFESAVSGWVGCYRDDNGRDLKEGPKKYGYTVATCRKEAEQRKMKYFSLQHNGWCATDNVFSRDPAKYDEKPQTECGATCKGETAQDDVLRCGAGWRNAVYETEPTTTTTTPAWGPLSYANEEQNNVAVTFIKDDDVGRIAACALSATVSTDVTFRVRRDDSYSDSVVKFIRLNGGYVETFALNGGYSDRTDLVYDGKTLTCTGSANSAQCKTLQRDQPTPALIISVDFKPKTGKAHNNQWDRNKFSISGSYYQADCPGLVGDIKIGDVPAFAKTSTCDGNGGRWILFGSITSTGGDFNAQDVTNSPTSSGVSKGDSVQIGTFTKGAPVDDVYSLDVQQLAASNIGSTFDLMIEYGNDTVYSHCISGFPMTGDKFINNDRTSAGVVVGEHGMWGSEKGPVDGYYATFCAYNGGCGSSGRDFWAFSTHGVYPNGASSVPCGFYYTEHWKQCPAGDNIQRMRYYIRFQDVTIQEPTIHQDFTASNTCGHYPFGVQGGKGCPGHSSNRRRNCLCPCFKGKFGTDGDGSHRRRCGVDGNGGVCPSKTFNDGTSDDCQSCSGSVNAYKTSCKVAQDPICPAGYSSIEENLDGAGKVWSQPHPASPTSEAARSLEQCADICTQRDGCTSFEYANGPLHKGACGTYTGGSSNIMGDEDRKETNSNWYSCVKQ